MSRSISHTTRIAGLASIAGLLAAPAATGQTVDFEDVAIASGTMLEVSPSVDSGGFRFAAADFLVLHHNFFAGIGASDSTTLSGQLVPISMTPIDGQPFDLVSIDVGEMNGVFSARTVQVTGFYAAGGSVTQSIVLDQIFDGPGGVNDLQTYVFDSSWTELSEVRFQGLNPMGMFFTQYVLDNIEVGGGVADTDGDGVPDDQDACPESDLRMTIHVGDIDTGVINMLFDDGCTMADLIASAMEGARNHGQAVSAVSHLTNDWKSQGLIHGREKGAIMSAAARSK